MARIFLSYRREDAAGHSGRLYDDLHEVFGNDVFRDIDTLEGGQNYAERINQAVADSDAFLAVIGDNWLTVTDGEGRRRLDKPDDWVRLEIRAALEQKVKVIPVLVGRAEMPPATALPDDIRGLVDLAGAGGAPLDLEVRRQRPGQGPRRSQPVAARPHPARHRRLRCRRRGRPRRFGRRGRPAGEHGTHRRTMPAGCDRGRERVMRSRSERRGGLSRPGGADERWRASSAPFGTPSTTSSASRARLRSARRSAAPIPTTSSRRPR